MSEWRGISVAKILKGSLVRVVHIGFLLAVLWHGQPREWFGVRIGRMSSLRGYSMIVKASLDDYWIVPIYQILQLKQGLL